MLHMSHKNKTIRLGPEQWFLWKSKKKVNITISDLSDDPGYNSTFLGLHSSPPVLPSGLDFGSSGRSTPTQSPRLEFGTTQLGEMGRSSSARKESKYRCMNY